MACSLFAASVVTVNSSMAASIAELRVLSLNFWNIPLPIVCKDQSQRLAALCDYLLAEKYDVVALQEVWFGDGHDMLVEKCGHIYPYTHVFARGFMGAGLLVLSRHTISDTLFMSFAPSGRPSMVHQADFYGSKGVGLCRVDVNGHQLDVYTSHIHASYSENVDDDVAYSPLRMAQMLQLCQFVRHTRRSDAAQLVMGDLNTWPHEECMKVLRDGVPLRDSWLVANGNEDGGCTSNTPHNCYSRNSGSPQRIDYVLFSGAGLECKACRVVARDIPGTKICYSDHDGVEAVFTLGEQSGSSVSAQAIPAPLLTKASDSLRQGVSQARQRLDSIRKRLLLSLLLLMALVFVAPSCCISSLLCVASTLFLAFHVFMFLVNKAEIREFLMLIASIKLQQLPPKTAGE